MIGGNKSLLFNAEYQFSIAGPVRLVAFYDVGQVRNFGEGFWWKEPITQAVYPPVVGPVLVDPYATARLLDPNAKIPTPDLVTIGTTSAFKTSTGLEIRFFMPVLNVPFRLIAAWNPQRGNVLDNSLQPAKSFTFRFAVSLLTGSGR